MGEGRKKVDGRGLRGRGRGMGEGEEEFGEGVMGNGESRI